jgi:hypothetical protein
MSGDALEQQIKNLFRTAEEEEGLGKDTMVMRPEAIQALLLAVQTAAPGFSSLNDCLTEMEKYISALKAIAMTDNSQFVDEEEFGTNRKPSDQSDVLGSSERERLIEMEIGRFCKRAGEELDKEMREEGVKALKIAANKFAYKLKYYDSANDKMIVFPSVTSCLAGYHVYEEAEKYYYDPEDEYPLKYIAALRDIALEEDGGDEDVKHMETMAAECSSDDGFFLSELRRQSTLYIIADKSRTV